MATILLQAAGAFIGGALGSVGSAIGSAAGAIAGYLIDRALIDSTRHQEGPRLSGARPFSAEEGAGLPRIYGTVRLGGTMIWGTRFEEDARTERQGGKGGPRVTTYSYFANVAFALCEGEIAGVRRVWADGREVDLDRVELRFHRGDGAQGPDPLIAARQGDGNTPAYRGTAYVVIDRFPLADYGNRIPQFQFEVLRPVGGLAGRVRAVAMIPGATEYGLSPSVVTRTPSPGEVVTENRHVLHARSDLVASLDELQALCPALEHVALVVSWFGSDLRAGNCTVRPKVTHRDGQTLSQDWRVSGIGRDEAAVVSSHGGGSAYGGTPSDRSVMDAIAELRARGLKVTLYPFVMMDVAADNGLADPWTGAGSQPAYPWRGRITCDPAPGRAGSADKSALARSQVTAFCGTATAGDFSAADDTVAYAGGDWGYRRMVLHYAALAAQAGGVDAFLLGSELRGLTTLRDGSGAFPFVEQLCDLAGQVRSILGATKITYGADWSEYFGHQPADGSGDVCFHLDALWAHPAIDAVGIDCYMPLSDWRDGDEAGTNPDGFDHPYDPDGLRAGITSGEGFDWYYASSADRLARARTPIADGAHGKAWVFRYKDLLSWWSNHHYDRQAGVESGSPTAWQPRSKPIWLTELGCPAVDKGPNQPNVFPDLKSSEAATPYFSSGGRSDMASRSLIRAHLDHWDGEAPDFSAAANPVSDLYGERMLDGGRIYLWAWDARPSPAFPGRTDVWSDGENWLLGHWLNGRLNELALPDLINAILTDCGMAAADTSGVSGTLAGYLVDSPTSARAALEPLVDLYGLVVADKGGSLSFAAEEACVGEPVPVDDFVVGQERPTCSRTRLPDHDLPAEMSLVFSDAGRDYQSATARMVVAGAGHGGIEQLSLPGVLDPSMAEALLADRARRKWTAREQVAFAVEQARIDLLPGSAFQIGTGAGAADFLVTSVEAGAAREIAARRILPVAPSPWRSLLPAQPKTPVARAGQPLALLLDLPMLPGAAGPHDQFKLAVRAKPWAAHAAYASPAVTGFERRALASQEAVIGRLSAPMAPGFEGRFDRASAVELDLLHGELASVTDLHVLNGANLAAVLARNGEWELLQFAGAEEIAPARWRLRRLLRGQYGTRPAMLAGADGGAWFVVLDRAVVPAGLREIEVGLELNWHIGPIGYDFAGPTFAALSARGGLRARRPLSPVHLAARRLQDGALRLDWMRRARIDADRGLAGEVALDEANEAYRIEVAPAGGPVLRSQTTVQPWWRYEPETIAADFGGAPQAIAIAVRQIGSVEGDPAEILFNLE